MPKNDVREVSASCSGIKKEVVDTEANMLRREALQASGKTYEIALAHSDRCFSRRYGERMGSEAVYDKGPIRLASCLVL